MSRGNQGHAIFRIDRDCHLFLEKQVLAWWLRERTVVSRTWVSERFRGVTQPRMTQPVAAAKWTRDGAMLRWRAQLERLLKAIPESADS